MKNKDAKSGLDATINNGRATVSEVGGRCGLNDFEKGSQRGQLSVIYTILYWFSAGSIELHYFNCMVENLNNKYGYNIPLMEEVESQTDYLTRIVNHIKTIDSGVIDELVIHRY